MDDMVTKVHAHFGRIDVLVGLTASDITPSSTRPALIIFTISALVSDTPRSVAKRIRETGRALRMTA